MTGTISSNALAWLLTYAIHSTILLALVWLLVRLRRLSPGASELLWKSAMVGALVTTSAQVWLDVRPMSGVRWAVGGEREARAERREALVRTAHSEQSPDSQLVSSQQCSWFAMVVRR